VFNFFGRAVHAVIVRAKAAFVVNRARSADAAVSLNFAFAFSYRLRAIQPLVTRFGAFVVAGTIGAEAFVYVLLYFFNSGHVSFLEIKKD
jgi:hypothetical protein